jgi:hypothetical protein
VALDDGGLPLGVGLEVQDGVEAPADRRADLDAALGAVDAHAGRG